MIFKDYYKILGLDTNKVTISQIKTAYRELAKKYHPDVNVGNKNAEDKFKDINEAYRILSENGTRRKYDRTWYAMVGRKKKNNNQAEETTAFASFFTMLFGSKNNKKNDTNKSSQKDKIKGENIETEISIGIEEAFYGIEKAISLRTIDGNMKTFKINIPAGIRNNEKVRLIGQGKEGKNGGKNGDLFIKVHIENSEQFVLKGYDLYTNLYLTPWEAALGTKTTVNTIDDMVKICVKNGIQSGEQIKIENKGYKDGKGGRGNLIVNIKIVVPNKLTKEEESLFYKLKEISKFKPREKVNINSV